MGKASRLVAMSLMVFALAGSAQAGVFENVLTGLYEAGFNFVGEENFLSGGADFSMSRNFRGETLDFGSTELTLTGTPVLTMTTGGRSLPVLDLSFNTNDSPFYYTLVTDSGSQETIVDGSLYYDATASVNTFGWYDFDFEVSSRQTVTQDGRFVNESVENDFDVGPISVQGNIFADLLATVTDPIFDLLGAPNIFASFSGAYQFQEQLDAKSKALLAKASMGESLTAEEVADLAALTTTAKVMGYSTPDLSFLDYATIIPSEGGTVVDTQTTPEPTMLLPVALAALLLRRRGSRH